MQELWAYSFYAAYKFPQTLRFKLPPLSSAGQT